tara:strand:+ start:159 stop:311 length:153 start_codon:yes stop_codon:yes gene_type:complete
MPNYINDLVDQANKERWSNAKLGKFVKEIALANKLAKGIITPKPSKKFRR